MATNTPFGQRLGLVLEGGAMRGIYTAGVLDVFLEAGIMPDVVVGVSAGALHGCSYVAGQKGRSIAATAKSHRSDKALYGPVFPADHRRCGGHQVLMRISLRLDPLTLLLLKKAPLIFMSP